MTKVIEERADVLAFLVRVLGVPTGGWEAL
jgi:hypothetical protein